MADKKQPKAQKISMTKDERKLALAESQKLKEKEFKLLVKIISWENGSLGSTAVSTNNKVTKEEWEQYKKHRGGVFTAIDKNKAKSDLENTYNSIKANGGFK